MDRRLRWVLLAYRLPREPSTPRIGIWRQLRRLGVAHVADGVVGLPLDARTREQLEWVAEEVVDNGGEATIWLAELTTSAQERAFARRMASAVEADYQRSIASASAGLAMPAGARRRAVARLRRELRRIRARDYVPGRIADQARDAVEALAETLEQAS